MEGSWRVLLLFAGVTRMSVCYNVTVSVNTTHRLHLTDDKFLSLSVPPTFFLTQNYSAATKSMLRGLSPAYLRVGSLESDKIYFTKPLNVSDGHVFTISQWNALQKLVDEVGVKLVFTTNSHPRDLGSDTWDSFEVLKLLQLSDEQGLSIPSSWQLGYGTNFTHSGSKLGWDVARLRKILDLFPQYQSAGVLGPDVPACVSSECLRFLRDFLLQAGDIISTLIVQFKPESDYKEEEVAFQKITQLINDVDAKISTRHALQGSFKSLLKKQLWISETEAEKYTGEFTDALVWTLKLGQAAKLGYDVVLHHLGQLTTPTPDYWVSLLFHRLVGHAMLDIHPASHPSVTVLAHCTTPSYGPGAVTIWGVNAAEHIVSLSLPHPHTILYTLTASSHKGNTLLNGKELLLNQGASLPELQPQEFFAGPVPISAYSVFYIVLPDLNAPACFSYRRTVSPSVNQFQHETTSFAPTTTKTSIEQLPFFVRLLIGHKILLPNSSRNNNTGTLMNNSNLSDSRPKETTKDNKQAGLVNYIRFKRSDFRKDQISNIEQIEIPPSYGTLKKKLITRHFNIFKKFQEMNKSMDGENFEKYQKSFKLFEDPVFQNNNGHNKEPIHYFPGEFYNKLRTLISKSNEQLQDVEDPHEAISLITKDFPNSVEESTLKITSKLSNEQSVDLKIVEGTTEKMEHYYKHAAEVLNEALCSNSKHEGKLKCCMEHETVVDISAPQFELEENQRLNKIQRDNVLKIINEPSFINENTNNTAHNSNPNKNNIMKREISRYVYSKSNEPTPLNSTKLLSIEQSSNYPLEEDEKFTLLLEELTDEGEQLLKSFDRDEAKNELEHKLTSVNGFSIDDINFSNENMNHSNLKNDFFVNETVAENTNQSMNTVLSSPQRSSFEKSTEKKDITKGNKNSDPSLLPERVKNENKNKSSEVFENNTFLHIVDDNTSTNREIQMKGKYLTRSSEKTDKDSTIDNLQASSLVSNNYQIDNLKEGVNKPLKIQIYETSIPSNVQNDDNNSSNDNILPSNDDNNKSINKAQLLNKNSVALMTTNKNNLPIYRLQQLQPRQDSVKNRLLKSNRSLQSTPLITMISNMRKQRLESLRARLESARKRILNLAKSKTSNEQQVFKREISQSPGMFEEMSNMQDATIKDDLKSLEEDSFKYFLANVLVKPLLIESVSHQSKSDKLDKNIKHLQTDENKLHNKPNDVISSSKDVKGTDVSPLNALISSLSTENNILYSGVRPNDELVNQGLQHGSNSYFKNIQRIPRSIQTPCIRDRFNDFETEGQEVVQPNTNVQPGNEHREVNTSKSILQSVQPLENAKKEAKNSSGTTEFRIPQNYMKRLKRSIVDDIHTNELEMKGLLTNEILKEGLKASLNPGKSTPDTIIQNVLANTPLRKTGVDRILDLAKQYNPSSLEILSNKLIPKGVTSIIGTDENKALEAIDTEDFKTIKDFLKNSLSELQVVKASNNVLPKPPDTFSSEAEDFNPQQINSSEGIFQDNFISHYISKVQKFFKAITSVIKNLSKTEI